MDRSDIAKMSTPSQSESSEYFKTVTINGESSKSSIRKISLSFTINDVVNEIDETVIPLKCYAEGHVAIDCSINLHVLKDFGYVSSLKLYL